MSHPLAQLQKQMKNCLWGLYTEDALHLFPKFLKAHGCILQPIYIFSIYLVSQFFPQLNFQEGVSPVAGSCGSGIRPSLGSFIAEHVTPRSNSLQRCRFKANFLRCINTAPCGSFEQDSWSDAAIQLPGYSVCFADCGQIVPSLAGKSQAVFWQKGCRRSQALGYEWLHS